MQFLQFHLMHLNWEKKNVIKYLELLSNNADAANILTNGSIVLVLLKMLRDSKLANSGILGALIDGLRDRKEKMRRFSMAALDELLFYISTQNEHARDNKPMESPSKDNRPSSCSKSNNFIGFIAFTKQRGDITQLYALRTIDNIFRQRGAPGKQEIMRLTTGSCLARLVHFNPYSTSHGITFIQGYVFKTRQAFEGKGTVICGSTLYEWEEVAATILNAKLLSTVDRLVKEKDDVVK
ncbi:hypothetical protein KY284_010784 [Solanum tuberosum]|nr:hypothetical protein KY284_010784 [Solanum tuberosum]